LKFIKKNYKKNRLGFNESELEIKLFEAERLKKHFTDWMSPANGVEYILADGNHRSVAYILNNQDIPARELETFQDILEINKEFKLSGTKGPAIMRESKSLKQYFFKFYRSPSHRSSIYNLGGKVKSLMNSNELRIENNKVIYEPNIPF
jgi:hypothetical protein